MAHISIVNDDNLFYAKPDFAFFFSRINNVYGIPILDRDTICNTIFYASIQLIKSTPNSIFGAFFQLVVGNIPCALDGKFYTVIIPHLALFVNAFAFFFFLLIGKRNLTVTVGTAKLRNGIQIQPFRLTYKGTLLVGSASLLARKRVLNLHNLIEDSFRTARLALDQTFYKIGVAQHILGGDLRNFASRRIQILLLTFGELRTAFFPFKQFFQLFLGFRLIFAEKFRTALSFLALLHQNDRYVSKKCINLR